MTTEIRYCDTGCGYKLPPEYQPDETTCGACLDTHTCANCATTDPARDIQSGLCAACFAAMPDGGWCSTPWPVEVTA